MIIREWRGRALRSHAAAYPEHFTNSVVPQLRTLRGFIGAHLCQRRKGELVEFIVLTRWESFDAIRGFAGQDFGTAVVEPGAVAALTDFDTTVQHYEVLTEVATCATQTPCADPVRRVPSP
jgi:heme-degrading monooxygenase HmoA